MEEKRKVLIVDPPSGWKYGFPKPIPKDRINDLEAWLVENGYPKSEIFEGMPCRFFEMHEDHHVFTNYSIS